MRVRVLGSAAGGGVPQWNCHCPVCAIAWSDPARVRHRTQTSLAVTADDRSWVLLDAAPDLRQQIVDTPPLHPRRAGRHSPISAVVLTSGEVDHIAGLLCLREGQPFTLFGTAAALGNVAASPVFGVLNPAVVEQHALPLDEPVTIAGLQVTLFSVPGKIPLYRESGTVSVGDATEDVVGVDVSDGIHRLCYVPGIARLTPELVRRLGSADLLMLDGTTFTDDEMPGLGLSTKTAGRMGHMAMDGPGGSLHAFPRDARARTIYIHLNNSNPALIEDSPQRAAVLEAGWEVAHDGLDIVL